MNYYLLLLMIFLTLIIIPIVVFVIISSYMFIANKIDKANINKEYEKMSEYYEKRDNEIKNRITNEFNAVQPYTKDNVGIYLDKNSYYPKLYFVESRDYHSVTNAPSNLELRDANPLFKKSIYTTSPVTNLEKLLNKMQTEYDYYVNISVPTEITSLKVSTMYPMIYFIKTKTDSFIAVRNVHIEGIEEDWTFYSYNSQFSNELYQQLNDYNFE